MATASFCGFLEQLVGPNDLRCRKMFGGYSLYIWPDPFRILFDGWLYFEASPVALRDYPAFHPHYLHPQKNGF